MTDAAQFPWVVVAAVVALVVALLGLRNDQALACDEEGEQVGLPGFKQSERYQATWARVRDYIDGWKHVNNGR